MKPRQNMSTMSLLSSTALLGVVALLLVIALWSPTLGVGTTKLMGQRGGIAPAQETPDPTATATPGASATPTADSSTTPIASATATPVEGTATPTATPTPAPAFVPFVARNYGSARHVDVPTATTVPTY